MDYRRLHTYLAELVVGFCVASSLFSKTTIAEDLLTDIQRETRTDSVEEKLLLLQRAYESGHFDIALSLAESLKETIQCEKQMNGDPGKPDIAVNNPTTVSSLPQRWARWAIGWKYFHPIKVSEASGIARAQEPIDLLMSFDNQHVDDLRREIRIAKVDDATGSLQEIVSQVYGVRRRGAKQFCRVVFYADVSANGATDYLIFFGNPLAELPEYASDLKVDGEQYGLDIANDHFVAQLSKQTGQLERLRYKRQHGLELYAGGKGHGEPPTIDWSNDYVDQEHYQKLRIRNWDEPPNYEVVRGPLMVSVRRWGFPHSPIHPVFTPSRMHVDQTYVFYAGKDYFVKEGTMEAAKDFEFTTMRDDEWVLSGYSFTDKVWLDNDGKLHEGDVPAERAKSMWGVGFYHEQSRDAFIALWLEHSARGIDRLERNGVPTLHYHQHGQLWSRYPLGDGEQEFKRGTTLFQKNAYLVAPYPDEDAAEKIKEIRTRLVNPLTVSSGEVPQLQDDAAIGRLARDGEIPKTGALKPAIWDALRGIRDEQLYRIDANVVDMGLIYDVTVRDGVVEVLMTMPHHGRPVYQYLVTQGGGRNTKGIRERLLQIDGVEKVIVNFTWHPAWTIDRLSDAGRKSLGLEVR